MPNLHEKQWFLDRIGKRIYRDASTCKCPSCEDVLQNGLIIKNEQEADYLWNVERDYLLEGVFLNYRDEK